MKAQGTDGVPRGQPKEGIAIGSKLTDWLKSWVTPGAKFLEPTDWFERGHDDISGGAYNDKGCPFTFQLFLRERLFGPPSCSRNGFRAAETSSDQTSRFFPSDLLGGQLKCMNPSPLELSSPLLIVDRGSSEEHRKCSPMWHKSCAVCLKKKTWMQGIFCDNFYWSVSGFHPCQKMWCEKCYTFDPEVKFHVRTVAVKHNRSEKDPFHQMHLEPHRSPNDFLVAHDGDHTLVSFECDFCIFRNLKHRNPDPTLNLDAFWSHSSWTVRGHRDSIKQGLKFSKLAGLSGPYIQDGPLPNHDHCGYEIAIKMLIYSRSSTGKYSLEYIQFDTIRKLRSSYGNFSMDQIKQTMFPYPWGTRKGDIDCSPQTLVVPSGSLILSMDADIEWVASLRGSEGLLLNLAGLKRHLGDIHDKYVTIALLGKIKGEHHDLAHLLPCVPVTSSGIQVRNAITDLIDLKEKAGFVDGPAISDISGKAFTS
eukprot:scaffold422659_cov59-Attheya_sp.AAC.2